MKSYTRVFHNPEKLEEMLALRKQGWNLSQLARFYGTDHTSIRHWVVKFDLVKIELKRVGEISQIPLEKRTAIPTPGADLYYTDWNGERIFAGKSYDQIRAEAEERKKKNPIKRAELPINFRGRIY